MNKRLTRIAPVKAGLVLGVLYALLACIMVPFMMMAGAGLAAVARQTGSGPALPFGFMFGIGALFLPVIYGVFGFVGGLIAAAVYNLVAKWTGGLEVTVTDVTPPLI